MQATAGPLLSLSPSFNTYSSSDKLAQIAARVVNEFTQQQQQLPDWVTPDHDVILHTQTQPPTTSGFFTTTTNSVDKVPVPQEPQNDDVVEDDDEFEFAFVSREPNTSPISADEIFYNGQIRPVYPLFNQRLLNDVELAPKNDDMDRAVKINSSNTTAAPNQKQRRLPLRMLMIEEERETASSCSSSSEADDLENLSPGTYCVWNPKASPGRGRCNKSNSTGSSKRWKFRDLLYRSRSDGKDTFVFLPHPVSKMRTDKDDNGVAKKRVVVGGVSPPRGERFVRSRAVEEGKKDKRRSFLPYRQDIVGFFSNVNGLSRNLHPF